MQIRIQDPKNVHMDPDRGEGGGGGVNTKELKITLQIFN